MAMKPGFKLQQTQRLSLTPELRLSIRVLAMSAGELAEMIAAELAENPLLDWHEARARPSGQAYDYALDTVAETRTPAEILARQIALMQAPGNIRRIAEYLCSDLTEAGYLAESAWALARDLAVEQSEVDQAISLLQMCEPAGIGARDLRECLDLQLKALGEAPETRQLVLKNLTGFAEADWPLLGRQSGLDLPELKRLRNVLQSLDPYPALRLTTGTGQYLVPDISIEPRQGGGFSIELIDSPASSLVVNHELFAAARSDDAQSLSYLNRNLTRANGLIRAIEARARTVLKVAQKIARHQSDFFAGGRDSLKPMTQADIAGELGLHPSTVTRAIAGKSLSCPQGVFPLKFFFPSAIDSLNGDPALSAYVVQQEIRRMIGAEKVGAILSDAKIAAALRQSGVDIARRTVAKYRQCLNIPSSTHRRRSKRFL